MTITPETKRVANSFDPHQPRDREGKWVETGAELRNLLTRRRGTVVGIQRGNSFRETRYTVDTGGGNVETWEQSSVQVTRDPDGSTPSAAKPGTPEARAERSGGTTSSDRGSLSSAIDAVYSDGSTGGAGGERGIASHVDAAYANDAGSSRDVTQGIADIYAGQADKPDTAAPEGVDSEGADSDRAQALRARLSTLTDAQVRKEWRKLSKSDPDLVAEVVVPELDRRGFGPDGHPKAGSKHGLKKPVKPGPEIAGNRVAYRVNGSEGDRNNPDDWSVGTLEQGPDGTWQIVTYTAATDNPDEHGEADVREVVETLDPEDWVDVITPEDPRTGGLDPRTLTTPELDQQISTLQARAQGMWNQGSRMDTDHRFVELSNQLRKLSDERDTRLDDDPVDPGGTGDLFDELPDPPGKRPKRTPAARKPTGTARVTTTSEKFPSVDAYRTWAAQQGDKDAEANVYLSPSGQYAVKKNPGRGYMIVATGPRARLPLHGTPSSNGIKEMQAWADHLDANAKWLDADGNRIDWTDPASKDKVSGSTINGEPSGPALVTMAADWDRSRGRTKRTSFAIQSDEQQKADRVRAAERDTRLKPILDDGYQRVSGGHGMVDKTVNIGDEIVVTGPDGHERARGTVRDFERRYGVSTYRSEVVLTNGSVVKLAGGTENRDDQFFVRPETDRLLPRMEDVQRRDDGGWSFRSGVWRFEIGPDGALAADPVRETHGYDPRYSDGAADGLRDSGVLAYGPDDFEHAGYSRGGLTSEAARRGPLLTPEARAKLENHGIQPVKDDDADTTPPDEPDTPPEPEGYPYPADVESGDELVAHTERAAGPEIAAAVRGVTDLLDRHQRARGSADEAPMRQEEVSPAWAAADDALRAAIGSTEDDDAATYLQQLDDQLKAEIMDAGLVALSPEARQVAAGLPDMTDQHVVDLLYTHRLDGDILDEVVEPELERRGYDRNGDALPGSKAGLLDPQQPSDELVGRRVAYRDDKGADAKSPNGWVVGTLERDPSSDDPDKQWVLVTHPADAQESRDPVSAGTWVDPVDPDDVRIDALDVAAMTVPELDAAIRRHQQEAQRLWDAGERPPSSRGFREESDRLQALGAERDKRPDDGPSDPGGTGDLFDLFDGDDDTPPSPGGDGNGGGDGGVHPRPGPLGRIPDTDGRPDGAGTLDDPIHVGNDLARAAALLAEGKHVRLSQPDQVATLLDRLRETVAHAEAHGKKAPNYDLCRVSVPGTNLFCKQSKGIPRTKMPQLSGPVVPGSPATAKADERGKANIGPDFRDALVAKGIPVTRKTVLASHLRASQSELDGVKVAEMVAAMRKGKIDETRSIFVSRDGYVIDGHHRWAATVARETDGEDVHLVVEEIDLDIGAAIDHANAFSLAMGIQPKPGVVVPDDIKSDAPLDDAQYTEHTANVEAAIKKALADGLNTDAVHTLDGNGQVWTPERAAIHREIVDALWAKTDGVPRDGKAIIAGGLGGAGKALALDTPVVTPGGLRPIGDLRAGDMVIGADGKATRVVYATEPEIDRPCYLVSFDDGATIVADGEHLWTVTSTASRRTVTPCETKPLMGLTSRVYSTSYPADEDLVAAAAAAGSMTALATEIGISRGSLRDYLARRPELNTAVRGAVTSRLGDGDRRARYAPRPGAVGSWSEQTLTTEDLVARGVMMHRGDGRSEARWATRLARPVQHETSDALPVSPYLLGAWLGDGTSAAPHITTMDPEILRRIEADGYRIVPLRYASYRARDGRAGLFKVFAPADEIPQSGVIGEEPAERQYRSGVWPALRSINVARNKHIPAAYLNAPEADRRDLLAGLLDTDGTIDARNGRRIIFGHVVSERLAADVVALVSSLGYKATTITKVINGTTYYGVGFTTSDPVFHLERKTSLQRTAPEKRAGRRNDLRYIVSIEPAPSVPVRCIKVEAVDGLFLVTDRHVVTHNSTVLGKFAGIPQDQFLTINPDDVKEEMVRRGIVPEVDGLSPMEASPLVHEESSHIANMIAQRAYAERVNLIWDITMSSRGSVEKRIAQMRAAGYRDIQGIFVDIPLETSVERALARHRRGMEDYRQGQGPGGRYVPPALIRKNSDSEYSSANRRVFEGLRSQFDSWQSWDNSVHGRDPQKIDSSADHADAQVPIERVSPGTHVRVAGRNRDGQPLTVTGYADGSPYRDNRGDMIVDLLDNPDGTGMRRRIWVAPGTMAERVDPPDGAPAAAWASPPGAAQDFLAADVEGGTIQTTGRRGGDKSSWLYQSHIDGTFIRGEADTLEEAQASAEQAARDHLARISTPVDRSTLAPAQLAVLDDPKAFGRRFVQDGRVYEYNERGRKTLKSDRADAAQYVGTDAQQEHRMLANQALLERTPTGDVVGKIRIGLVQQGETIRRQGPVLWHDSREEARGLPDADRRVEGGTVASIEPVRSETGTWTRNRDGSARGARSYVVTFTDGRQVVLASQTNAEIIQVDTDPDPEQGHDLPSDPDAPVVEAVKPSLISEGDLIEYPLEDGATAVGTVLGKHEAAGKTVMSIRDDENRQILRAFDPGADINRITGGPEPVKLELSEARLFRPGDRVLLTDANGGETPVTVDQVSREPGGRALVIDVTRDGGGPERVVVDPDEMLQLVTTGAPDGEAVPTPALDDQPGDNLKYARGLTAGDRIVSYGDTITVLSDPRPDPRNPGLTRVRVRMTNGAEDDVTIRSDQPIVVADTPQLHEPTDLPDGAATTRPVLVTYQRRNVVALGLDDPANGQPDLVREAAARVRNRIPLTEEQSSALADVLRAQADAPGVRTTRQRSLRRAAASFDAAAAKLSGSQAPNLQAQSTVEKTSPTDVTEGDMVALPTIGGKADIVKVVGNRTLMRGRLHELTVEHADGSRETRLVHGDASVYLLPDLPDPNPAPAPEKPEHITPDRVNVGDTIHIERLSRETFKHEPVDVAVTDVKRAEGGSYQFTIGDLQNGSGDGPLVITMGSTADDGGPTVVRAARGGASADQPRDADMGDENPEEIGPSDIQVGDRVRLPNVFRTVTGTVISVEKIRENGADGVDVTVRGDDGTLITNSVFQDGEDKLVRLARSDENIRERVARANRERVIRNTSAVIGSDIAVARLNAVKSASLGADVGAGQGRIHSATKVAEWMTAYEWHWTEGRERAVTSIAGHLFPDDKAQQEAIKPRLREVVNQAVREELNNFAESIRDAVIMDGEHEFDAIRRVTGQRQQTPPKRDYANIGRSLVGMRDAVSGTSERETSMPSMPEGADIKARITAYRNAVPGQKFGSRAVVATTFKPTSIDDLEAGKVPETESVDTYIKDRAADGGPGEIAMLHHDIVKAAGQDLDTELNRRIAASDPSLGSDPEGTAARYQAESKAASEASWAAMNRKWGVLRSDPGYAEVEAEYEAARDQARVLNERYQTASKRLATLRRDHTIALLGEVREMGGVRMDYYDATSDGRRKKQLTERSELVKAMRQAEGTYPAEWLQAWSQKTSGAFGLRSGTRGWNSGVRAMITLDKDTSAKVEGGGPRDSVAVHELGHSMETAVPHLLAAQEAFLWSRTSTGEIGSRERQQLASLKGKGGATDSEQGYLDDFKLGYTGKDYGGRNYEVLTTGMESLMAGESYLDEDLRRWLLGTLAVL